MTEKEAIAAQKITGRMIIKPRILTTLRGDGEDYCLAGRDGKPNYLGFPLTPKMEEEKAYCELLDV